MLLACPGVPTQPWFPAPLSFPETPTIPVTFRKNILFRYGNFLKCVSTRKKYVPLSPALTSVMLRLQFLAWGSPGRENRPWVPSRSFCSGLFVATGGSPSRNQKHVDLSKGNPRMGKGAG